MASKNRSSISLRPEALEAVERAASAAGISVSEWVTREVEKATGAVIPRRAPAPQKRCSGCKRVTGHRKVGANETHVRWACNVCNRSRLDAVEVSP